MTETYTVLGAYGPIETTAEAAESARRSAQDAEYRRQRELGEVIRAMDQSLRDAVDAYVEHSADRGGRDVLRSVAADKRRPYALRLACSRLTDQPGDDWSVI